SSATISVVLWYGLLILVTVVMHLTRETQQSQAHVVLTYLLVVLGGSLSGGRPLGFTLAAAATILISYYFQYPFDTFSLTKPIDAVVLSAFFATSGTTTYLLVRAQDAADSGDANAAIIVAQTERLSKMVAHLLDMSRLNAGEFPVSIELNTVEDL